MKKLLLLLIITSITNSLLAQEQPIPAAGATMHIETAVAKEISLESENTAPGIHFQSENKDWKSILELAKKENKLIFLDAFASWCGPCKWMEKNVFPTQTVGDIYNQNFVSAQIDMEKGEGRILAKKYNVKAYPTYLYINSNGEQVHRGLGSMDIEKFTDLGLAATNPERQFASVKSKYLEGKQSPEFLLNFAKMCDVAQESELLEEVSDAYLKTQSEWSSKVNMDFIKEYTKSIEKPSFAYIIKNQPIFEKTYSKSDIEKFVYQTALKNVAAKTFDTSKKTYNFKLVDSYGNTYLPKAMTEKIASQLLVIQYKKALDTMSYLKQAIIHFDKYPSSDANELNQYAWDFYEKAKDKNQLKKALEWSLNSIKIEDKYGYNDTAAALYFKLKDKKNAILFAEKAIKQAKATDEDASETEELLLKINKL